MFLCLEIKQGTVVGKILCRIQVNGLKDGIHRQGTANNCFW